MFEAYNKHMGIKDYRLYYLGTRNFFQNSGIIFSKHLLFSRKTYFDDIFNKLLSLPIEFNKIYDLLTSLRPTS